MMIYHPKTSQNQPWRFPAMGPRSQEDIFGNKEGFWGMVLGETMARIEKSGFHIGFLYIFIGIQPREAWFSGRLPGEPQGFYRNYGIHIYRLWGLRIAGHH